MNESQEYDFILRNVQRNPEISRRRIMDWMLKSGFGLSAAAFLSGSAVSACQMSLAQGVGAPKGDGTFGGGGDSMRIAVVGPFSGIGSFLGAILDRSLNAAVKQVNATGGIGGRKIEILKKDISAADASQVINAYQDVAGQTDVAGLIWGVPGGPIVQLADRIATDKLLIAGAFSDLYTDNTMWPNNKALRSYFQFLIPTNWGLEVLAKYCKEDRGYNRVALLLDNTGGDDFKQLYRSTLSKYGLSSTGEATYTINNSNFGPQLSTVGDPQSLWIYGLATDVANAVKQLADAKKDYIGIDEAKSGARPHLMGSPAALGEKKWAELAGAAAKAGTLCGWHIGGLIYLPTFKMREWMQKYGDVQPTGGEETPADCMGMIANAVKKAGSVGDRQKLIEAVEQAGKQSFSSIDFEFSADNHLSKHPDDIILITLERGKPATPNYKLGKEWSEVFPQGYVGPTHLVRPTITENSRRHPELMQQIIDEGWGTNAPPGDPTH